MPAAIQNPSYNCPLTEACAAGETESLALNRTKLRSCQIVHFLEKQKKFGLVKHFAILAIIILIFLLKFLFNEKFFHFF